MAAEEKVASPLKRLADQAFLDVLSPRDKSSMADLITDDTQKDQTERKKMSLVIELH